MELRDILLTPLYLLVFYLLAFLLRPLVTDRFTRPYFIPGLTVKIVGALAVGFIYQFYYGGGDTFNYFHDAGIIWEAFLDSPGKAFQLIVIAKGEHVPETLEYSGRIWYYRDLASYAVVRFAGLFSILSFNTYAVIALFFALLSYSGLWVLYQTFYHLYPQLYRPLAWAVLFIPSVFFWGSGLLKDTLTLAAVGWATFAIYKLFFQRQHILLFSLILWASCLLIYNIKIYILLCFLPAAIVWVFLAHIGKVRSKALRWMFTPLMVVIATSLGYLAVLEVGEGNKRYNIDTFSYTAESTARWLTYVSEQQGGAVYSLGDFDFSPAGMLRKAPLAINVALFRPYLWEVNNPIMLLSALESFFLLLFTLYVFYKRGVGSTFKEIGKNHFLLFCFLFSLSFAFSIGIATYNFGSLVRYKIPLLPFYVAALVVLLPRPGAKRPRKFSAFTSTEKRAVTA